MELRLWKYGADDKYIKSFLESASLAHKQPLKSEKWFRWKFEQSPYGKAILACAFDGEVVAGCVALGLGIATHNQREVKCALSYETFVNPNYQGHGLFKKLITLAEESCKALGVEYLYNFPNSQSLPGFKRMGWKFRSKEIEYRIKIVNLFKFIKEIKSLRKPFYANNPKPSGIVYNTIIPSYIGEQNIVIPLWTAEYIKWRFIDFPQAQYVIFSNTQYFAIARVGYRGKLKECQILLLQNDKALSYKKAIALFSKHLISVESPDMISICCARNTSTSHELKYMLKVPTQANFTYKCLSDKIQPETKQILFGIDFHTY